MIVEVFAATLDFSSILKRAASKTVSDAYHAQFWLNVNDASCYRD